jgi:hypothetical protein
MVCFPDDPRLDRVLMDVPYESEETSILLNQKRLVASLEEMPRPAVPSVEGL